MNRAIERVRGAISRSLTIADAGMNRLYGWRGNPLYQSGTLVVLSFLVMLASGLYLLLFYRIGDPHASLLRIEAQAWAGRPLRAIHRYAADLALVATALHALRMFAQGRSWGPRLLAWISGFVLLFVLFVCGWTGYVMLWDDHALLLAAEGARLLDQLPIFSEPLARSFVGERPVPAAFFFLNLFAHVALPIGLALLLWVHVSKLARPVLLPPRGLALGVLLALTAAAIFTPPPLGPRADPFARPASIDVDWFYSFWVPWARGASPAAVWSVFLAVAAACLSAPWWTRPPRAQQPAPSRTDPHLCTGCFQCAEDCPFDAISMVEIAERDHPVALVAAKDCVSCGICAGSCAPMAVGPPGRSGRDEIDAVRRFLADHPQLGDAPVVIACRAGAGRSAELAEIDGAPVYPIDCAGNLHTSVIEFLLRGGARGVLVAACPPRDCSGREGPRWLIERVHHGREAELRESLDRTRLHITWAGAAERGRVVAELRVFRARLSALQRARAESDPALATECAPRPAEEARP